MRRRMISYHVSWLFGAALLLFGMVLVGIDAVAAAKAPTLSFTPNSNIGSTQVVSVIGSHFTPKTSGGLSQCNETPGEPTIVDSTTGQKEPVGCQIFTHLETTKKGMLPKSTSFTISSGVNGPPATGTASDGNDAADDALDYPCPPTAAEVNSGGQCVIVFTDVINETATEKIDYSTESTTTTVTTPTGCTAQSTATTSGPPFMIVNPGTCLVNEIDATVTSIGLKPNVPGAILECNMEADQPTVIDLGSPIPVGCSSLENHLITTAANGTVASNFTVHTGTIGPPATGTDSSGGSATTDAAKYPCPPTSAQVAAGVTCALELGDEASDLEQVEILFASEPCRFVTDGVVSSNDMVKSETADFTSADVGDSISGAYIPDATTILSVTSATTATMSASATAFASNVRLTICS